MDYRHHGNDDITNLTPDAVMKITCLDAELIAVNDASFELLWDR